MLDLNSLLTNITQFLQVKSQQDSKLPAYFSVSNDSSVTETNLESDWFCFIDPCFEATQVSTALRLLLAECISISRTSIRVICLKDIALSLKNAQVLIIDSLPSSTEALEAIGWELGPSNKPSPNKVSLAGILDPTEQARRAVDLNLQLMRWRMVPDLPLNAIQEQKALLLGSGTLGCEVARRLLAWNIGSITMIDNSTVSHSNPVRQSLYTFKDAVQGKNKAVAAAHRLKKIYPNINITGIECQIPMPGHPAEEQKTAEYTSQLEELIQQHDVVFLLTDSRESRWLPSLLSIKYNKTCLTIALGFETYVIVNHPNNSMFPNNACYFCSDITGPSNSIRDRTLDQQCTVSRPGISSIASSLGVELYISTLHPSLNYENEIPQQIRGSVRDWRLDVISTGRSSLCTACSDKILNVYDGAAFVMKVGQEPKIMEDVVGVSDMMTEDLMDQVIEWE